MLRSFGVLGVSAISICVAQVAGEATLDQIQNWPAPLYWQAPSRGSGRAVHGGRIRRESSAAAAPTASVSAPAVFVAMTPCRIVDTRYQTAPPSGPFGAPPFVATEVRTIAVPSGPCTVPANAVAYSLNIAVVPNPPGSPVRWLTAWDTDSFQPNAATLNDKAGLITSNSAVVPAGSSGAIDIFVTDPTNVIIDINGYYAPPSTLPLTGTAAAPALTFGDTTTGLYSDTAGTVSIGTGRTSRLTVRADGDLELPGSIRKRGTLFLQGDPSSLNTGVGLGALGTATATSSQANTAVGANALAGAAGFGNVAVGLSSLEMNSGGPQNTAVGVFSLQSNTTGSANAALGYAALSQNTTGDGNIAVGSWALTSNTAGSGNTAVGDSTIGSLRSGNNNIAVGVQAGVNTLSGDYNIYIGNTGPYSDLVGASESNTIRFGDSNQTRTFVTGIRGVTTGNADAVPVLIDSAGQLGTASSSRRVKSDIEDMGDTTETILGLRPVRFHYKARGADSPVQYGLIAEEVAEVAPDLLARDKDGRIETVYYDKVNAMLLNEVQKLHRLNQKLEARLAELENRTK